MIIWITGLSGAGKTTIARALISKFKDKIPYMFNVDGDEVRELFGNSLGYAEENRIEQIKRIQKLCLLLEKQKLLVIASALYSSPDLLEWNRKNFNKYFEIYIDASLDLVQERDVKGLYKKAKEGKEKNIVGIDIPWHEPKNPDLIIKASKNYSIDESIKPIINSISLFKNNFS